MKILSIVDLESARRTDGTELSAFLQMGRSRQNIYFRAAHDPVATSADPFVPAVLLPAMRGRFDLEVASPVADDILSAASRVQAVQAAWNRTWRIIDLQAAGETHSHDRSGDAVGVFFSGGVDSFYSLQKHREEITHAIFVSGFDIPVHRFGARELVARELRRVARALDIQLIEVETNLRDFSEGLGLSWDAQHGAALAAVAHFLAPGFRKIYVPSSNALPFLHPHGSHPGLDPLWSSTSLQIVHDGTEATRFDKIGAVRSWDLALENLRVCWQVVEGKYNCCRCRKCLWTMAFLRAHGSLERAKSFPVPLDLRALRRQSADNSEQRHRMIAAVAVVEKRGGDEQLVDALRAALRRVPRRRSMWRRTIRRFKLFSYNLVSRVVRFFRGTKRPVR